LVWVRTSLKLGMIMLQGRKIRVTKMYVKHELTGLWQLTGLQDIEIIMDQPIRSIDNR
jgi:hypothetical protein